MSSVMITARAASPPTQKDQRKGFDTGIGSVRPERIMAAQYLG